MSQEDFQQQVLRNFQELKADVDQKFAKLESDIKEANIRIDAYQRSSTQVVSLAFGLISASAAVVILSPAVKALSEFFLSR
ncbi:MAG: hypothetical protein LH649_15955 [Pseudanabaena sp. CAN_BIN31]|nr:hypothetical protein [Pseudanabaena sp. CAN_BIN31]